MDGWMDGRTDGLMDGWTDVRKCMCVCLTGDPGSGRLGLCKGAISPAQAKQITIASQLAAKPNQQNPPKACTPRRFKV